jgi:hypothetical protein
LPEQGYCCESLVVDAVTYIYITDFEIDSHRVHNEILQKVVLVSGYPHANNLPGKSKYPHANNLPGKSKTAIQEGPSWSDINVHLLPLSATQSPILFETLGMMGLIQTLFLSHLKAQLYTGHGNGGITSNTFSFKTVHQSIWV